MEFSNRTGTLLAAFVLLPSLTAAATAANSGRAIHNPGGLVRDSAAACCVLTATVLISYLKPFGRIRSPSSSST